MKVTIILLLAATLSVSNFRCPDKDEQKMAELISNTSKATNSEICYFNLTQIQSTIRYFIICDNRVCTQQDSEKVREQATLIEHKYNIPCYEVDKRSDANMIIRLK